MSNEMRDYLKRKSKFLTEEHVTALLSFTEKRFASADGQDLVFKLVQEGEGEDMRFAVKTWYERQYRGRNNPHGERKLTGHELFLLAELLKSQQLDN